MQSFFEKIICMLGLISAFALRKICNKHYFYKKALQSTTFWVNLKKMFFPYCMVGHVVFGDFIFTSIFQS
jgi:hypothetical protein